MTSAENITAWFADAAARHPDLQHTTAAPRFFELEWDEIIQNGGMSALTGYTLILEDYEERLEENTTDYFSRLLHLSFMVLRSVPQGDLPAKKANYAECQRIAEELLAKLYTDCEAGPCHADVPTGVRPPAKVFVKGAAGSRVGPIPAFDHAYGHRITVDVRTDQNVHMDASTVAWAPLP